MTPLRTTVLLLTFSLAFTACGKKGDLEPPERKSAVEQVQPARG